ncbi:MAG: hypothetical protein WCG82_11280, partial [Bacteroidota bacterium]
YLSITNATYASTNAVNATISISERYVGLTVNVNNIEYWYKDGVTNGDLIEKKYDQLQKNLDAIESANPALMQSTVIVNENNNLKN